MLGLELYIHNWSLLVKCGFIQIQERHSGLHCRSQLCLNFNQMPGKNWLGKLHLSHEYPSCISVSHTQGRGAQVGLNINATLENAAALPQISESVSHNLHQATNMV